VRYIAERTDLLPVRMLIGPFSLMTKFLADPISPVAMAGIQAKARLDRKTVRWTSILGLRHKKPRSGTLWSGLGRQAAELISDRLLEVAARQLVAERPILVDPPVAHRRQKS
jgi:hypothetical protein